MVDHGRPQRRTDRLGVGGRQPSRQHTVRTYSRVCGRSRLLFDVETLHLDRGHNSRIHRLCNSPTTTDVICVNRRPRDQANHIKLPTPLRIRWTVERTNSWLTNYGQIRRNTDRRTHHRQAQLNLTITLIITLIITIKLINWRDRCNPTDQPLPRAL